MKNQGIKNIIKVLDQADQIDIDEGKLAYFRYQEICRKIAKKYNYPLDLVVAVFVALSPNNDYKGNLRSALSVIEGHKNGDNLESIKISTYNHCRNRAFSYLNGVSFLETVKGNKIRSFYLNIMNPLDPDPVTIDGHAINIWKGQKVALKNVAARYFNYEQVANDYRFIAKQNDLLPNQLQAITWFTWKRINRILYKPQLNLFNNYQNDCWETLQTYEEATAF